MVRVPDSRLGAFAELIVRIGLNLRRGQGLVITDPYGGLGVDPAAAPLADAVQQAARAAGAREVRTIWSDPADLRQRLANNDQRGFVQLTAGHATTMLDALRSRDALLFLQSSPRSLWRDATPARAAEFHTLLWTHFGPIAQRLTAGATNWCAVPAPTPGWAELTYANLSPEDRAPALWQDVLRACRVAENSVTTLTDWAAHLSKLAVAAEQLNLRCVRRVHFAGPGTDLELKLPAGHVWCTARLQDTPGRAFVANLPSEEIFTAPDRSSAEGRLRVSRPIEYAGTVVEGLELKFTRGAVAAASARRGAEVIEQLLAIDEGARRLGEIAWVPGPSPIPADRFFGLALLDENAASHVALGNAYAFCSRKPEDPRLNRSLVHVDLPLEAEVKFID